MTITGSLFDPEHDEIVSCQWSGSEQPDDGPAVDLTLPECNPAGVTPLELIVPEALHTVTVTLEACDGTSSCSQDSADFSSN